MGNRGEGLNPDICRAKFGEDIILTHYPRIRRPLRSCPRGPPPLVLRQITEWNRTSPTSVNPPCLKRESNSLNGWQGIADFLGQPLSVPNAGHVLECPSPTWVGASMPSHRKALARSGIRWRARSDRDRIRRSYFRIETRPAVCPEAHACPQKETSAVRAAGWALGGITILAR